MNKSYSELGVWETYLKASARDVVMFGISFVVDWSLWRPQGSLQDPEGAVLNGMPGLTLPLNASLVSNIHGNY